MKFIKSISTSIFTLLLCTACESDLEQVTYSSENAIPSTLSSLNDNYILESKNASQEAFTLTWSHPDLGYQASVINSLEMDVKDKNFANKVILASSKTDVSHTITVSDLNSAAMVYFDGKAADGWKFCGTEDWSTDNWGAPESMTPEQSPVTLVSGNGGDIKAYSKNSYYLEFNNTTGELKVSKPHNSWGIVGDHNSWGSGDTMMTLETETDENNKFQYYLKATLDMSAGNKWKIRPEEKWEDDIAPGAVEGEFEDAGDGNFKVSEAGNYSIKWYFNKVTPKIIVVKNR